MQSPGSWVCSNNFPPTYGLSLQPRGVCVCVCHSYHHPKGNSEGPLQVSSQDQACLGVAADANFAPAWKPLVPGRQEVRRSPGEPSPPLDSDLLAWNGRRRKPGPEVSLAWVSERSPLPPQMPAKQRHEELPQLPPLFHEARLCVTSVAILGFHTTSPGSFSTIKLEALVTS